jgi:hypothetical protein
MGATQGAILVMTVMGWAGPASAQVPANSPLSWEPFAGPVEIDSTEAGLRASEHLGLLAPDMTLALVTLTDRHPFGEARETQAWLASVPSVCVEPLRGAAAWQTSLHVAVDAMDGRLLLAFTTPKAEWVTPGIAARDPEEQARNDKWAFERLTDSTVTSDVPQVLGSVWSHLIDVAEAGQIILRPREVSSGYPQPEVSGEITPAGTVRVRWIVQVLGTVTWPGEGNDYFTGLIALFEDENLALVRGVMMP